jgi:hypothetical protein
MTTPELSQRQRRTVAAQLDAIPSSCPAELHDWINKGFVTTEDEFGALVRDPVPDTSAGAACAMGAAVHKHGCCWCGKHLAGRELTDGHI